MTDDLADAETRLDVAECLLRECGTRTGEVCVYELACQNPYTGMGELHIAAEEVDVSIPHTVRIQPNVASQTVPIYVGESQRPVERIYDHTRGEGASFTKLFPPKRVRQLDWCEDKRAAQELEQERARELHRNIANPTIGGGR